LLARLPGILSAEEIGECRKALATAEWVDGRVTAGHRFEQVKRNRQLPELPPDRAPARRAGPDRARAQARWFCRRRCR